MQPAAKFCRHFIGMERNLHSVINIEYKKALVHQDVEN